MRHPQTYSVTSNTVFQIKKDTPDSNFLPTDLELAYRSRLTRYLDLDLVQLMETLEAYTIDPFT